MFINYLFNVINLITTTLYNDVQISWVLFTLYQKCLRSQARKLAFARSSGLNGVGEKVKLRKLGLKDQLVCAGGGGEEQRLLLFAGLTNV